MDIDDLDIDWNKENLQTIRLAQDFIRGNLTYCVFLPVKSSAIRQPSLINSKREIMAVNVQSLEDNLGVKVKDRYVDPSFNKIDAPDEYMRWSINSSDYSLRQFLEGDKSISTANVFMEVRKVFSDFIWTSPEDSGNHTILALYVMLSYVFQIFSAIPYLNLWGTKASGKSQTLTLLYKLAFNAVMGSSVTAPAQFRLTEKHCNTLLLDEHNLSASSKNTDGDLLPVLNSGYKKDGAAVRCEGEEFKPASYITFSPKIIAGTEELPSQLLDRCILIDTERIPNTSLSSLDVKEYNSRAEEARLQLLVDKLHYWGLEWAPEITKIYDGYKDQDIPQLRGRDRELWHPFLVIAELIDSAMDSNATGTESDVKSLRELIIEIASKNKEMRDQLDREDEKDRELLVSIIEFRGDSKNLLADKLDWFVAKDLAEYIKGALEYKYLATNTVRSRLIKLKVMDGSADSHMSMNIHSKTRTCYRIPLKRLLSVARKYGIDTKILGYPGDIEIESHLRKIRGKRGSDKYKNSKGDAKKATAAPETSDNDKSENPDDESDNEADDDDDNRMKSAKNKVSTKSLQSRIDEKMKELGNQNDNPDK